MAMGFTPENFGPLMQSVFTGGMTEQDLFSQLMGGNRGAGDASGFTSGLRPYPAGGFSLVPPQNSWSDAKTFVMPSAVTGPGMSMAPQPSPAAPMRTARGLLAQPAKEKGGGFLDDLLASGMFGLLPQMFANKSGGGALFGGLPGLLAGK